MNSPQALSHLRVLDLSRVLAGPWASQIFADMGADVIKIERPGSGDDTRHWGPPFLANAAGKATDEAAYFLAANRGKSSVAVDISTADGQNIVRRLAAKSDILLENYKVGGLHKYGLDYASLKELNPKLIYCSITGFGQTGPLSDRPGYDFLIQGMGGLMGVTGETDDEPGGGPQKAGVAFADLLTGLYASTAILAAVTHREQSGVGQHIDLALLDVQTACLANQAMNYLISGRSPERLGNAHPNIVPYQTFATADGHIIIAVGNDQQFGRLCRALSLAELADDPRYRDNQARVQNRQTLVPLLAANLAAECSRHWLELLETEQIPCGPINSIEQVFATDQVQHRKMQIELPHRLNKTVPEVANPIKFSATPIQYRHAGPTLGEHTETVLSSVLEMDETALTELRQKNVIA